MSDSENTAPKPVDKEQAKRILLGDVTIEQPNELGIPVSTTELESSAELGADTE